MRALRVVGLDEDGETVICEDPENGDRFSVPADERLRAAARGDLTRLGQVQIEMEAQLRPREIQARIRAGASVEDVAASSGVPEQRVERYAYPVLLERAQIAERSQRAHPVREDGPDVQTLGEVVARNERLDEQPELVNSAPFGDGWMLEIKLADPAAPDALLGPEDYQAVIDQA